MQCESIQETLPLVVLGEAPEEVERATRSHLETCEVCRDEWHALSGSVDQLDSWSLPPGPSTDVDTIAGAAAGRSGFRWATLRWVAAAIVVIAAYAHLTSVQSERDRQIDELQRELQAVQLERQAVDEMLARHARQTLGSIRLLDQRHEKDVLTLAATMEKSQQEVLRLLRAQERRLLARMSKPSP